MLKALIFLLVLAIPIAAFAEATPSVGLPPTTPLTTSTAGSLTVQFNSTGLSSLQWNGAEMLATGMPTLGYVGLIQPDGSWVGGDQNPVSTMDVANRVLTQKLQWGTIKYAYTTTETQLFADVTIQNSSTTPVGMFIIQLAEVKFPSTPAEYDGSDPMVAWNMGNPSIIHTSFNGGTLVTTNEDVVNPLMIGYPWSLDSTKTTFPLRVLTGGDAMYPTSFPFINRQIPAGGALEFKIGFRFGQAGAGNYALAGDVYQRFAQTFPQKLNWPDRRPVAQLMLSSYNGTYGTNPRRWFGDASVDTTTSTGIAAFQQRVLAYAANAVSICQAENAQAAVTWDIEGEQFAQPTSYNGDPRLAPALAPEIDPVLNAYFKKFTDAGIKVGMTIRPQQLVLSASNTQAVQQEVADPGALMIAKIGYAYNRWGARVFYVDSNGAPDCPIDPKYFQAVLAAYPDILLMPEQSNMGYYACSAPYGQFNMGVTGPPAETSWVYPGAWRVFTVSDSNVAGNMQTLVNSVLSGNALFFRGWFNASENPQVTQIYQTAHATNSAYPWP